MDEQAAGANVLALGVLNCKRMLSAIGLALLLGGEQAWGAVIFDINDVMVNFKRPCDAPARQVNLGDLHITLSKDAPVNPGDPPKGMVATFTVDPSISGAGSGDTHIWDCLSLHYVQLITADACPAKLAGVAAGTAGLPFPVIDPPAGGWDYMFNDNDAPADGIQADERVPGNISDPIWAGEPIDNLPWYPQFPGFGNQECVEYVMNDEPGFCPANGVTSFSTFLVAEPSTTCPDSADCLAPGDILLLAGFNWAWASNAIGISSAGVPNAATVKTAIGNSGFSGWDVTDTGTICCPIPEPASLATLSLLAMSLLGMHGVRFPRLLFYREGAERAEA